MAGQNDGRIPGGPTTPLVIQERESHISSLVFLGQLYDYPEVKLREHGDWRSSWELTVGQKALVEAFGFHHVDAIRIRRHDKDLILSLIERWWPLRNTFQLPVGEITITLADVAQILGLPITGNPIYFDEQLSPSDLIRTYLGVEPPSDLGTNSSVRLTWLRSTFMHVDHIGDTTVSADDSRVLCCTRAYLLSLCGAFLFPDSTGNKVNVRLLPFLEDLGTCTKHAWGAALLAHLYHSMTSFVSIGPGGRTSKNICGCMTLVQFWSYEHFSIGRPVSLHSDDERVFPGGIRWNTDNIDSHHCVYKVVSIYRGLFDTLNADEVQWQPHSVPQSIIDGARAGSIHRYYIIYHGYHVSSS
ncbi:protein DEFECTIVE IN MERISTEM SILENCING 3 [Iris pallida]|uniref:Protein DEFECTIVE IN MERISTEM SILENCING 3 n=1 Tax=Iris pallida TaxID=29817 RepID=A0AAX6E606_IRIPA|nr:protein DEFECTIVE IN MERISTEM SILENCING 3 [Iris pallida]